MGFTSTKSLPALVPEVAAQDGLVGIGAIPAQCSDFSSIEFVNSAFGDHLGGSAAVDRLPLAEWQAWFLERFGFTAAGQSETPLSALQVTRAELRLMLEHWAASRELGPQDVAKLNGWLSRTTLRQRLVAVSSRMELAVEPEQRDWDWVIAAIAASAAELMVAGQPDRLKVCANPTCTWMFYDETRNGSRLFCSPDVCGNIVRVRRFRRRKSSVS